MIRLDNLQQAKQRAIDKAIKREALKGIQRKINPEKNAFTFFLNIYAFVNKNVLNN